MSVISIRSLQAMKERHEKFTMLTAYDASFAQAAAQAGVEVLLVGDSLGNVVQGQSSTLPVTVADMAYHTAAVARGCQSQLLEQQPLIITDLPFMSYGTLEQGLDSARAVMQAGAHMVKVEGDSWLIPLIESLARQGVPVCAHLGLTPQSVNKFGGYRVQGREQEAAETMLEHAIRLAEAGTDMLLLECVPSELAQRITAAVAVPVVGIGAGNSTDAQVLVMHDMLGLNPRPAKFVKNYLTEGRTIQQAFAAYVEEVKAGTFPSAQYEFKA